MARKSGRASLEQRPRISGRETVLKVSFRRKFSDSPGRVLAREKLPELLTEHQSRAAAFPIGASRTREIDQVERSAFSCEPFRHQFQTPARLFLDVDDAPDYVALVVPRLHGETRVAHVEQTVSAGDRNDWLAGFEQCGFSGGLEKTLNCRLELLGASAGSPPGGGVTHYPYCSLRTADAAFSLFLTGMRHALSSFCAVSVDAGPARLWQRRHSR